MRTDGPVVIALDGAPHSASTLAWGMAEAVRRRADVVLARVVGDPWVSSAWAWYAIPDTGADESVAAKEYLADVQLTEEARHPSIGIDTRALTGSVVPALRDLSTDAQLVVVGAGLPAGQRGSGAIGTHLAAHAHCPVAVVRSDPDSRTLPEAPIVVGVDGSPASVAAAHVAAHEAWMRGRALVVVHARRTIADDFELGAAGADDARLRAAWLVTEALVASRPGLDVHLELVDDDPAEALVELADGAALLVVGSRGLGAFRGMLLGSVSHDVVRTATCPVLVVHDG